MNRPDFKKASEMRTGLLSRDKALKEIIDSEALLSNEAFLSLGSLRDEISLNTLNNTPLSALNAKKQGIRISALSQAGYNSIGDLTHLSLSEIDSIKGIGTGSASLIFNTIREIEKTVYENSRIRLSASSKTAGALSLVSSLYKIIHTESIRKSSALLYHEKHRSIEDTVSASSCIGNTFFWIFSGKEKKAKTVDGIRRLSDLYAGDFIPHADRLINDYNSVIRVSGNDAWNDFLLRSAFYYTALENLTEKYAGADEITEIHDRIRSDVPEELADEIDKYELKLDGMKTALRS